MEVLDTVVSQASMRVQTVQEPLCEDEPLCDEVLQPENGVIHLGAGVGGHKTSKLRPKLRHERLKNS